MSKTCVTFRYVSRNMARLAFIGLLSSLGSIALSDLTFYLTDHSGLMATTVQTLPFELIAVLFALLAGFLYFIPHFHVVLANGISRKTYLAASLTAAAGFAALFSLLGMLLTLAHSIFWPAVLMTKLFYPFHAWPALVLLQFAGYLFCALAGCLSALVTYRASPLLRWAYFMTPVALFIGLVADVNGSGKIFAAVKDFSLTILGLRGTPYPNPYIAMLSLLVGATLLGSAIYLLLRRAPLKVN